MRNAIAIPLRLMPLSGIGLGLVASGKRSIGSGEQYSNLFDMANLVGTDPFLNQDGSNYDTLRSMESIAKLSKGDTKNLTRKIKGTSLNETLSKIYNFLYRNVQYERDDKKIEQVRTPLRTWKDRKRGVDCDCFATFISTMLLNLGISHAYRMADYGEGYQHVYIVVPKDGKEKSLESKGQYYTVDPVVDQYNYEVPFKKKHDRFMALHRQNGLGDAPTCSNVKPTKNISYQDLLRVSYIEENGLVVTEKYLIQNLIPFDKSTLPNGSVRYHVGKMTVGPVITKQEASALISPANTSPTPTTPGTTPTPTTPGTSSPSTKTNGSNAWKWILGISGALIAASQGQKVLNGLAGFGKKKHKKKNLK